jgi:hypothetical protein
VVQQKQCAAEQMKVTMKAEHHALIIKRRNRADAARRQLEVVLAG